MTGYWQYQPLNQGLLAPRPLNSFSFNSPQEAGSYLTVLAGEATSGCAVSSGASEPGNISDGVGVSAKAAGGEGWVGSQGGCIRDKLSASPLFQLARRNTEVSMVIERKQSPFLIEPLFHGVPVSVCLFASLTEAHSHKRTHRHTHSSPMSSG